MRRAFPLLLSLLLCSRLFAAEETPANGRHISALRSLSINRSLLTRAEEEYRILQESEPEPRSDAATKRLSDLLYKIQALNDDAERLRRILPPGERAGVSLLDETVQIRVPHVDPKKEKKIEENTRQAHRLHEKALDLVASRRFAEAEKFYEEIILMNPDDDEAYLLLGHAGIAAGHYEKAAAAFRSALSIDARNAREIPRLYENILVENPSDVEAMTQLGYAHLLLGNGKEARLAFEDALKIDPQNEQARRGLLEIP